MSDKKPTHTVYYSRNRGGDKKDQLTAIGAAFAHTGDGYGLTIDVPLTLSAGDRLVLLKRKEKDGE